MPPNNKPFRQAPNRPKLRFRKNHPIMSIDLHCHSHVSDGALSPRDLVHKAAANGAQVLALTDHDHIGGLAQAREAAAEVNIRLINGVEVSVTWRGRVVHILGLNFADAADELAAALAQVRQGRDMRLQQMADKLARKGIPGAYEGALALASGNPEMVGRAHLARFLLNQGHVRNMQQAFKRWLGEGKPAYVAHEWASLADAVAWINRAGGVAVIAHPARYGLSATAMRALVEAFKELGGAAIEVASSSHSLSERLNYALLAERYQLYASAGSDFHAPGEGGCVLGQPPALPPICRPVWSLWDIQAA